MVVIPEILLQKAIVGGLQAIKADTRLIDNLFKNANQKTLADVRNYITKTTIDWSVNYPRKEQLNVPAIVLIMRGETEAETFLGDHMGTSPDYDTPDPDMLVDTLGGHSASVTDLYGFSGPVLAAGLAVASSTTTSVTIAPASLAQYQAIFPSLANTGQSVALYVVGGTGAGQSRTITVVSSETVDIEPAFDVVLDTSSIIDIRQVSGKYTEGEPSRVYSQTGLYERIGVHYSTQYQLQILAGHQEEVIFLYSIVKALLLLQRPFLEGQGMLVFKLSGSDFAPRGDYLPSDIFMRVLNIDFTYPFSVVKELEVAKQLQVDVYADGNGIITNSTPITIGPFTIG